MSTEKTKRLNIILRQIHEKIEQLETSFKTDLLLHHTTSPSKLLIDIYDIIQAIEQMNSTIPDTHRNFRTFSELQTRLIYALKSQLAAIYLEIYHVKRTAKS